MTTATYELDLTFRFQTDSDVGGGGITPIAHLDSFNGGTSFTSWGVGMFDSLNASGSVWYWGVEPITLLPGEIVTSATLHMIVREVNHRGHVFRYYSSEEDGIPAGTSIHQTWDEWFAEGSPHFTRVKTHYRPRDGSAGGFFSPVPFTVLWEEDTFGPSETINVLVGPDPEFEDVERTAEMHSPGTRDWASGMALIMWSTNASGNNGNRAKYEVSEMWMVLETILPVLPYIDGELLDDRRVFTSGHPY